MGKKWSLIRHYRDSPSFRASTNFAILLFTLSLIFGAPFFKSQFLRLYNGAIGNKPKLSATAMLIDKIVPNEKTADLSTVENIKSMYWYMNSIGVNFYKYYYLFTSENNIDHKKYCSFHFLLDDIEDSQDNYDIYPKSHPEPQTDCDNQEVEILIPNLGPNLDYVRGQVCFDEKMSITKVYGNDLKKYDDDCITFRKDNFGINESVEGQVCIQGTSTPANTISKFSVHYSWYNKEYKIDKYNKLELRSVSVENCSLEGHYSNLPTYKSGSEYNLLD